MKKINIIVLLAILFSGLTYGQGEGEPNFESSEFKNKRERLKAEKVAFITEKLDLSSAEAEKFWPVYNDFDKKRNELRKSGRLLHKSMREGLDDFSDQEIEAKLDEGLNLKESESRLARERHNSLREVISIKKVATLYGAEKRFKRELIRKIGRPGAPKPPRLEER